MPLKSESQLPNLGYEEVLHYELDIDEYIYIFNKLMNIKGGKEECQIEMAHNLF